MGFLLGLEHANLAIVSHRRSRNSDVNQPIVHENLNKLKDGETDLSKGIKTKNEVHRLSDGQGPSKPWVEVKEVTNIHDWPHAQLCDDCHASNDVNIRHRLKRTLSKIGTKWHSSEKLSLVKVNKPTSQGVTGLRYTAGFDANDRISGRSCSCAAINASQPFESEDQAVMKFKYSQRASI